MNIPEMHQYRDLLVPTTIFLPLIIPMKMKLKLENRELKDGIKYTTFSVL